MKAKTISIAAIAIVAVLFAAIGVYVGLQRMQPGLTQTGATASLMLQTLPDAQGTAHEMAQWKGKNLVVNFWATWCAPCVEEMPELTALQGEVRSKNTQIIGLSIDSPSNVREFASKYKIDYPLYIAGISGTELSRQFGNQAGGLPFTVLIGADGKIKKTYLGRLKMDVLRADLNAL